MEKRRILIVDDDARLSHLIRAMLDKTEIYETAVENRPFHVLATARNFKPDLVLLDVDMPGKDGGSIAREMHVDPALRDVAIIFLTSLVSKHEAGMREIAGQRACFLSKPPASAELVGAIEETLSQIVMPGVTAP